MSVLTCTGDTEQSVVQSYQWQATVGTRQNPLTAQPTMKAVKAARQCVHVAHRQK